MTVTVYVLSAAVVSSGVTMTSMTLAPTVSEMGLPATPLVRVARVSPESPAVMTCPRWPASAVTVTVRVPKGTLAV